MGNLVATLRGPAADVLNVVPEDTWTSEGICNTLNHRFGMDARCDLIRAQLQHRKIKHGETLQELAQDVYQSVRTASRGLTKETWDKLATERFTAALPDPEVRTQVELQGLTTVHRAAKYVERLTFLRKSNRESDRPSVTVRQVEVQDKEERQEESSIIRMLRGISRQLSNLTKGKFEAGESQRCDLGSPTGQPDPRRVGPGFGRGAPSGFLDSPFMGSCFTCGRRGHMQRYCQNPPICRPPSRPHSPERGGPPNGSQGPERGSLPRVGLAATAGCPGNLGGPSIRGQCSAGKWAEKHPSLVRIVHCGRIGTG